MASLYRALVSKAAINKAGGGLPFDVTMEATHHGPHVSLPTAFIEIGSTENEWEVPELGQFWANLLLEHFTAPLFFAVPRKASDGGIVAMSIGGGHYVPKVCPFSNLPKLSIHLLPSPLFPPNNEA
jgi:D-aminoacyl-tRNA deacylase